MKADKASARATLDRDEWIEAAIDLLAEEGVQGMRVEVLAKNFGVTKGSFYWHFKDRQDLVEVGVLESLARRPPPATSTSKPSPRPAARSEQLLHLDRCLLGATRNRKGISIELAVREWAQA
jgi:AcrR family transcriptional regulator